MPTPTKRTAPAAANLADLGTVLRGTGTAWFDDVTLECLDPGAAVVHEGRVLHGPVKQVMRGGDQPVRERGQIGGRGPALAPVQPEREGPQGGAHDRRVARAQAG